MQQAKHDGGKIETTVESVLGLGEVAMGVLGEVESITESQNWPSKVQIEIALDSSPSLSCFPDEPIFAPPRQAHHVSLLRIVANQVAL